ncbi:unnamed protein product [Lathyrus oleraceus]
MLLLDMWSDTYSSSEGVHMQLATMIYMFSIYKLWNGLAPHNKVRYQLHVQDSDMNRQELVHLKQLVADVEFDKSRISDLLYMIQASLNTAESDALVMKQKISVGLKSEEIHSQQHNESFSNQNNTNDGPLVSRHNIQEKSMFGPTALGINSRVNVENLQQMNHEQRFVSMQDFNRRQELAGSSELSSQDKIVQVPPSQNVARLDPTEEKILFGSDDSLWDGFGTNISDINNVDDTDSSSGFPSLQSGSWSVLLQSAVAETPSSDMGIQEEWTGFGFRNMGQLSGNEQPSTTDGSKQQSVWANSNMKTPSNLNSRPFIQPDDVSKPPIAENHHGVSELHQSSPDSSHQQHDRLQTDSQRPIPQWLLFLYRGATFVDLSPHPFAVADAAYRLVINGGINQSVLAHQVVEEGCEFFAMWMLWR